ncbi:MAG: thiamine pyrophosphate-dependent enzyme, partial [Cyanobacteria bacterium J06631_6]
PIKKFAAYLTEKGLATAAELKEIDNKVQATVNEAVKFAESSPEPNPADLHRYIFAED